MQLIHKSEKIILENNLSSINEIFMKVNELIKTKDTVFSHLIIDDVILYENHESYIKEHIDGIVTIEIITKSITEMIWETMQSIQQYLLRAIPTLNELVEEGYENFSDKSWNGINQLAEGMQWILQFKEITEAAVKQPRNWSVILESLKSCEESFAQLLEAVEASDTILISDILSYEVSPAYESLKVNLETALGDKEFLQDVN